MIKEGDVIRITKGIGQGKLARVLGVQTKGLCTSEEFIIKAELIEPIGRIKYRYLWWNEFIDNPSKRNNNE